MFNHNLRSVSATFGSVTCNNGKKIIYSCPKHVIERNSGALSSHVMRGQRLPQWFSTALSPILGGIHLLRDRILVTF